ncbi:hypothetical protein FQA39_LY16783 [Lamprigera yunnana]|nr:hypothetical protein FQA39_LY16783 [Lamprigera yunnana]
MEKYISSIESAISIESYLNLSTKCYNAVEKYTNGLKENQQWALSMFDANSKMESGLLRGNVRHLGSFDECISVNEDFGNITLIGKYCLANLIFNDVNIAMKNGSKTVFQGAICFPSGCATKEIQQIHHAINIPIFPLTPTCYIAESKPFDAASICAIVIFGIILCLVVTSTTYEYIMRYNRKSSHILLKSFSLISNGERLLTVTGPKEDQILCLFGIRVFTMAWIVYFHVMLLKMGTTSQLHIDEWRNTVTSKILYGAPLGVDTFFLISGLLLSYNERNSLKKCVKFNIIKFYINRYLRLTPTLAVIILVCVAFVTYLGVGPMLITQNISSMNCRRYWWSALLYVQNFVNVDDMCVGESWYLCVEMQIFLVSPLLLIPLRKKPKVTLAIAIVPLLISLALSFASVWLLDMTITKSFFKNYYVKPYFRVAPWISGLILGYYLSISQESKLVIGKATNVLLTITALITIMFCIYAQPSIIFSEEQNQFVFASRITFIRQLWCIAICWIIYSCVNGYNDIFNRFLSMGAFQVLSKITYSAYLLHMTIISLFLSISRTATVLTPTAVLMEGCAYLVITVFISTIITLCIEMPALILTKYFIKS